MHLKGNAFDPRGLAFTVGWAGAGWGSHLAKKALSVLLLGGWLEGRTANTRSPLCYSEARLLQEAPALPTHFLPPVQRLLEAICFLSLLINCGPDDVNGETSGRGCEIHAAARPRSQRKAFALPHCTVTIVFCACSVAVLKENISAGPCCVL